MIHLIYGQDELVRAFLCEQLGMELSRNAYVGVSIADDDQLLGGIMWYNHTPEMIEMNLATLHPRWLNRRIIQEVFDYPFRQLGVKRVQAICDKKNKKLRRLMCGDGKTEGIGFKEEGCHPFALPGGRTAISAGLYKHIYEEKWLNGKTRCKHTAAA